MSSFHHSRARIAFDAACALGISGSCVAAWTQTYAPAMLSCAAIAGLYGLVRAFDMRRRTVPDDQSVRPLVSPAIAPPEPQPEPESVIREVPLEELVGETVKRAGKASRKKAARKTKEKPALPALEVAPEAVEPEPVAEPEPELHVVHSAADEPEHSPVTPLFEAEPFLRQQRAAFGRKARF